MEIGRANMGYETPYLIIDCFDSFTYNLFHYLDDLTSGNTSVVRYDHFDPSLVKKIQKVVLSPGPGLPKEYPKISDFLQLCETEQPVLGVCLGMQAMIEFCGGELMQMPSVKHGLTSEFNHTESSSIFNGLPSSFQIGHYHSWVAEESSLPDNLEITGRNEDGFIMSITHKTHRWNGVQFHPESVLTPNGYQLLKNWVEMTKSS